MKIELNWLAIAVSL
ncbi:Protein of unknown function [Bacillus cereus]|nr:Protein of unknown function [Bacillus cereus]